MFIYSLHNLKTFHLAKFHKWLKLSTVFYLQITSIKKANTMCLEKDKLISPHYSVLNKRIKFLDTYY